MGVDTRAEKRDAAGRAGGARPAGSASTFFASEWAKAGNIAFVAALLTA